VQLILNGMVSGLSYALVALGFSLIFATTRFFHFSHGAAYATGAYVGYAVIVLSGFNPWLGFLLGIVAAGVLGALMELSVYRPLRRSRASSLVMLISSIGMYVVFQNLISLIFGDSTKVLRRGATQAGLHFLGARITPIQLAIVTMSPMLCAAVWMVLKFSRFGKLQRAVANDRELATVVGINTERTILLTFMLGSMLAGIAGILIGYDSDLTPSMGFRALLMAVVASIIGGVGSIPGAVVSGLLLGIVQNCAAWTLPTQWQDSIVFLILIIFLIFRPQGLLGKQDTSAIIGL
jgi:branched-chain amino acid transport system permease protein